MSLINIISQLTDNELDGLREFIRYGGGESHVLPNNLGIVKSIVESHREDSIMYSVVEHEGQLYRLDGHYDSWNGTEWADISELRPVKAKIVEVTVYE